MKIKQAGQILKVSKTIRSLLDELDNTSINDDEKLRDLIGGIKTQADSAFALVVGLAQTAETQRRSRSIFEVESSNIFSVEFDDGVQPGVPFPKVELTVNFVNGGSYKYSDVPLSNARELVSAPSPGRYYHREIKGVYNSEKLR